MSDPIDKQLAAVDFVRERTIPKTRIPSEAIEWEEERNKLDAEIERLQGRIDTLEEVMRETASDLRDVGATRPLAAIGWLADDLEKALKDV